MGNPLLVAAVNQYSYKISAQASVLEPNCKKFGNDARPY